MQASYYFYYKLVKQPTALYSSKSTLVDWNLIRENHVCLQNLVEISCLSMGRESGMRAGFVASKGE